MYYKTKGNDNLKVLARNVIAITFGFHPFSLIKEEVKELRRLWGKKEDGVSEDQSDGPRDEGSGYPCGKDHTRIFTDHIRIFTDMKGLVYTFLSSHCKALF